MSLHVRDKETNADPHDTLPCSSLDHASLLHPAGSPGTVILAHKDGRQWPHLAVTPRDLPDAIRSFKHQDDVFITFARFRSHYRRIACLGQITALFSDLDYYKKPALADKSPGWVMESACRHLEDEQLPLPTFAVGTGRGVLFAWLHEPVPRAALPRWNEAQRQISVALRDFGADANCKDATRLTRLIGSRNSKSGCLVESLMSPEPAWDFDRLMDEVLPFTRSDWTAQHHDSGGRHIAPVRRFTAASLWHTRLDDLQRLKELRFFGPLPPGERDAWLFVAGVGVSWLVEAAKLEPELIHLGREATDGAWSARAIRSQLSTVIRKAMDAAKGRTVEFAGQQMDSRYRLSSEWIVNALGITREEQSQMRTLIDDDLRRERKRDYLRIRRRKAGMIPREDYERQAAERAALIQHLRDSNLSLRAIGQAVGMSPEGVRQALLRNLNKGTSGGDFVSIHGFRLLTSDHAGFSAEDACSLTESAPLAAGGIAPSETQSRAGGDFVSIHGFRYGTPLMGELVSPTGQFVMGKDSLDEYALLLSNDTPPLAEAATLPLTGSAARHS